MTYTLPEYDGPKYKFRGPMFWMSPIPLFGFINAMGALVFLLLERNNREVTSVPAEARATALVGTATNVLYTVLAMGWWFL